MENQLTTVNLIVFNISPLKSLNLYLIPSAKLSAHRGTWTGCVEGGEIKDKTDGGGWGGEIGRGGVADGDLVVLLMVTDNSVLIGNLTLVD